MVREKYYFGSTGSFGRVKVMTLFVFRSPFDRLSQYLIVRNRIMDTIVAIVRAANVPSGDMFKAPPIIISVSEHNQSTIVVVFAVCR
jgi:hypothetical protein